jgi:sporulation protein YlmC with PRC-barrel domain
MRATVYVLTLAACMAATSSPTHAQTNTSGDQQFISQANPGEWRASKLVGLAIYGPDNQSIGKVNDVIIDGSGAVKAVVVGVGGFLGVGQKDVSLPFSELKWSDEPIVEPMPTLATLPLSTNQAASPLGTTSPLGTASSGSSAIPPPRKTVYDYPDHGSVSLTKDQLKAAPDFHYASGNS